MTTLREQAREAYAQALEAQGPAYRNVANNVRAGFDNIWIAPAIAALEGVLRLAPYEADDEESGAKAQDDR